MGYTCVHHSGLSEDLGGNPKTSEFQWTIIIFHLKMAILGYTTDHILRHTHMCIKHTHIYIYANSDILIVIMTIIVVPCNKRCDMILIMTMIVMLTIAVYVCIMLCVHSRTDV